ncbi:MAG TPA: DUF2141 domain-containing protein [Tepidisphaeraceae bacterium]|jgi:uncharacterized protein (DUF2141 family)|nr:DUF2141 domain-containing protein [Tepidisphaeraceae bacterium]
MKTLLLTAIAALGLTTAANAADVTVHVHGVQARHGTLLLALQSRDQFMKPAMTNGGSKPDPTAGDDTFVLHNVPAGDYAISVLHDENGDFQMKLDPNGRPLEGWAVTRFAGHHKPSFDECAVHVGEDGATFDVSMTYPN